MLTLVTYPGNKNAWKVKIAAQFRSGLSLQECTPEAEEAAGALSKGPLGKVPALLVADEDGQQQVLFESHAIAKFVCKLGEGGSDLLGSTPLMQAQVDQWVEFSSRELDAPLLSLYLPLLNIWHHDKRVEHAAKDTLAASLRALEPHLQGCEFLVGSQLTLADIVVCCDVYHGFTKLFDDKYRSKFPAATAHFQRCVALPEFEGVMGQVELCQKPLRRQVGKKGAAARHPAPAAAPALLDEEQQEQVGEEGQEEEQLPPSLPSQAAAEQEEG